MLLIYFRLEAPCQEDDKDDEEESEMVSCILDLGKEIATVMFLKLSYTCYNKVKTAPLKLLIIKLKKVSLVNENYINYKILQSLAPVNQTPLNQQNSLKTRFSFSKSIFQYIM